MAMVLISDGTNDGVWIGSDKTLIGLSTGIIFRSPPPYSSVHVTILPWTSYYDATIYERRPSMTLADLAVKLIKRKCI